MTIQRPTKNGLGWLTDDALAYFKDSYGPEAFSRIVGSNRSMSLEEVAWHRSRLQLYQELELLQQRLAQEGPKTS